MTRFRRHRLLRLGRNDRGTAAIEFGLVAPIFFALLLGIIDVGRYMWTLNTTQYAIDQAIRAGVVRGLSETEVEAKVKQSLTGLNASAFTVTAVVGASTLAITAETTYEFLFPMSSFMDTTTISLRTEMPR